MLAFRWAQLRERALGQFADLRLRAEEHRTAAVGPPDDTAAEQRATNDAADAMDFAVVVLTGAMLAVVEAALSRASDEPAEIG